MQAHYSRADHSTIISSEHNALSQHLHTREPLAPGSIAGHNTLSLASRVSILRHFSDVPKGERELTNFGVPVALQEPARVEPGQLAPGPRGPPPPPEHVAAVGLAVGDAVPALEDLLAGVFVAERGPRGGVAHPLAGGVVAGLGGLAWRGEGPRRGRGRQVEEEQKQWQQEEREEEGAPPWAPGRAPRRRRHGRRRRESPARWTSARAKQTLGLHNF
jgi:hypothetical protein